MKKRMTAILTLILVTFFVSYSYAEQETSGYKADRRSTKAVAQTAKWTKKWWMPRHEKILKEIKEKKKIDLLMVGDSITHYWEKNVHVWNKYFKKHNPYNIGFSGDCTEHVLWRLQNGEVEGLNPKLIVVMIGTNNTGQRQESSVDTAYGVKAVVEELHVRMPNSNILLLAIFPRGRNENDKIRKLNAGVNEIIKDYANDDYLFYLDINDKFLDAKGNLSKEVMGDFLHPGAKGYDIWGKALTPSLKKLMKKRKKSKKKKKK